MKNVFKFFIALLTLACLSCQDEGETNDAQTKTATIDEDISIIKSLGLDVSTIVDEGDYYLVEGDIALNKENLRGSISSTDSSGLQLRQGVAASRLLSMANAKNITIKLDSSIPTTGRGAEWRDAVVSAIDAWNNIPGCCIKFTLTTGTANVTVKTAYNNTNGAIAWTDIPSNYQTANELFVNTFFNDYDYKANTIAHEFGHVVGLLHSHETPSSQEADGIVIPGTPEIDNESIMAYSRVRSLFPGFNYYDIIAILYLYPDLSAFTATSNIIASNQNVTYSISKYSGPVTWSAVSNVSLVSGQGTANGTFKGSGNGYASIKADVTYSGNTFTLTNNKAVWVGAPIQKTDPSLTYNGKVGYSQAFTVDFEGIDETTKYTWKLTSGSATFTPNASGNSISLIPNNTSLFSLRVDVTNKAGTGTGIYLLKAGSSSVGGLD